MSNVLEGIRIVEVAQWWFVPAAGAILADWGAEVLKIEHPVSGDPQRGLVTSGLIPSSGGVNFMVEQPNRGKRSIGIDLNQAKGLEILQRLVKSADVFLTNFLPAARQRIGIDVEHIRAINAFDTEAVIATFAEDAYVNDVQREIVGIDIDVEPARVRADVVTFAREACDRLDVAFDESSVEVVAGHAGPAYGVPHDATIEAIRLGGRLDLDSEPGSGTRIQIILPRVAPMEQAAE